jgi:predicted RNA binding protein YcfA (HicA-like mRNA interferase family)
VIVPDHREIRIGTLQSIIRQSQLPRALFESS